VEPQSFGRDDRSRLADVRPKDLAERGMDEVRGRVVTLDVLAPRFVDLRARGRRLEGLAERADHRTLAVDFFDALDRQLPAFALHDAGVADLATRLGVKGVLLEDQLELVTGLPEGDRLRLSFRGLVADPLLRALLFYLDPISRPRPPSTAVDHLPRSPGSPALSPERLLESCDVDGLSTLPGDHLRQVDREAVRIVELERVLAGDRRGALQLLESRQAALDRLQEPL